VPIGRTGDIMKKAGIILAAVMALTISGCSEVPEDVRSRTEERQDGDVTRTVVDSNGNETVIEKIGNITFNCEPEPIVASEFYILKSRVGEEYDETKNYIELKDKLRKASKEFFGLELTEEQITVHGSEGEPLTDDNGKPIDTVEMAWAVYNDEHHNFELTDWSDSFTLWGSDKAKGMLVHKYLEREVYFPDSYPNTEYDMNDGSKMTVAKAVEQGEAIVRKCGELGLLEKNVTPVLSRIAVHKTSEGNVINLFYRKKVCGVYLNSDGLLNFDPKSDELRYSYFDISFIGDNDVYFIRNTFSDILEKGEKVDIMPYSEARQRVGNGLAKNMVYTVTEAGLRYTCIYKQLEKQQEYHPMWCFVLEDHNLEHRTYKEEQLMTDEKVDSSQYYKRVTAFVDAVTGDLYYCDPFDGVLSVSEAGH